MPSNPVGPDGVQPPVNPGQNDNIQQKQDESGQHGHRKVSTSEPEKNVLVRPGPSPQARKKIADFSSIKPVTPESPQLKQPEPQSPKPVEKESQPPQSQGLDVRQGDSRYESRADIIRSAKRNKAWQTLEKQIEKKDGTTSKKGFKKLLAAMPKMDYSNKQVVSLLALFAIEKFDSGKFTEAQMKEYMDAFMEGYTQAKADEQIQQAMLMLPQPPKKGVKTVGHSLNRAVVLAEIAAMTSDKSKGEDATATAFKNLKTDLQADLYDRGSEFLKKLTSNFEPRVVEINQKVAAGMEREMQRLMAREGGSKKRKLSPQLQQTMIKDVDIMVQQFVESQLREKKQKIDQYTSEGRFADVEAITDMVLVKARARRAGMIGVLVKNAGPGLGSTCEQHTVPESLQPDRVLDNWMIDNGTKQPDQKHSVKTEAVAQEQNPDKSVHELEVWATQLLQLVSAQYRTEVDIEQLREALLKKAIQLDVAEGLLPSKEELSPFSRNDPLRRAVRRKKSAPFAPVKPETVTETLGQAIKKELAVRAARRAEQELQYSRVRSESPVDRQETSSKPNKVSEEVKDTTQTETIQSKRSSSRKLDTDGIVPKLVRKFEQIIEAHDKQHRKQASRPAAFVNRPQD